MIKIILFLLSVGLFAKWINKQQSPTIVTVHWTTEVMESLTSVDSSEILQRSANSLSAKISDHIDSDLLERLSVKH